MIYGYMSGEHVTLTTTSTHWCVFIMPISNNTAQNHQGFLVHSVTHSLKPESESYVKSTPSLADYRDAAVDSFADSDDAASESGAGVSSGETELVTAFAEIVDVRVNNHRPPDDGQGTCQGQRQEIFTVPKTS